MNKLATLSLAAGIAVVATGAWAQQQATGDPSLWESTVDSPEVELRADPATVQEEPEVLPHAHSADGKCTIVATGSGTASVCCEGQPGHHRHQAAETPPPPPPPPPRPIPYGSRG